ncbi:bifunctional diaminohydroxyphosphoribosylaminopyrimidine deaminase/5-amino-6-(5-phosphoribosylamino)uracil reductase RibD [Pontixanthobacter aestiaquae]|uniref:Riboflavin biosynthesis protein RibD n=1 Tax=Pontixanthobacter aestiaquae TaxID=1509367 RepID=A0A844Z4W1_9SPHN|nr:bifunctional diaminohydroxyphosphoribosylaminopyrimidine deaminase/5-amino-6-(5-phosphoribosylamino)uracil reductase RibD [Pontixanthobacter aestiaquae]MDN3646240.1 bifunctional diaminohydroxyphosphoribosylaminopyrimidine deaminase/5-amino-6-(5-phosphoribosylamino)uracil reductase RibD [Pontixanthobacter aestiaquae]MXO82768.1 bifunctional diaminohydroxyphosphoribosylaminopyrimidine deaminase/5-amino-6-(5-phosphoribosylamino)uracil reductase RibD [Pontixanthobacter aestiaquae]
MHSDSDWLAAAARLGLRGRPLSRPNPSVGAIIVKHGKVVGRGHTRAGGRPHAEKIALDDAGEDAKGAALYTSLEPCNHESERGPACSDIIARSGISRMVFAVTDPDPRTAGSGAEKLRRAGIKVSQIDCAQASASLAGYLTQKARGRPHVTLKLATSLDGFVALPSGESQWITGDQARAHVHSRRAQADAILVGGGTWRADKPRLDVRLAGLEERSPQRILLTRGIAPDGVKIINRPEQIAALDDVLYLYVEGGGQTAASFLSADLVDRIELYRAPIIMGAGQSSVADIGLEKLSAAHGRWQLAEQRMLGSDTYEVYERVQPNQGTTTGNGE